VNPVDLFLTALTAMRMNLLRTLLTMLGIIIGIGAVITLTAATEGAQKGVTDKVAGLGANLMFVKPKATDGSGGVNIPGLGPSLFWEDSQHVAEQQHRGIEAIAAQGSVGKPGDLIQAQVIYRGQNISTQMVGTEPNYQQVRNFYVEDGRFLSPDDMDKKALVVVLGKAVAEKVFGASDPLGESVRIFAGVGRFGIGFNFTVVGVMEPRGGTATSNEDNQIFVPLPSFQARLPRQFRNARGYTNIDQINIKLADGANESALKIDIAADMRKSRELQQGAPDDFEIFSQQDVLSTATEVERSFQVLVVSIALIALIVGGIGIMNIMLVSVTERTREIGIRKAVGARRWDILFQFLIEAIVVTLIGGLIGVAAGWGATQIAANWDIGGADNEYAVTAQWVLLGIGVAAATGIIAGVYPAWSASRLDPIEALRHE
jgi:putative ABC transport system permease protein